MIQQCLTPDNADATKELVTYTHMATSAHLIDLNAVGAVVGRFYIEGAHPRWAIIDRSGPGARPTFNDGESDEALLGAYED